MEQPITAERSAVLVGLAYAAALNNAARWGVSLREVSCVSAKPTPFGWRAEVGVHRHGLCVSWSGTDLNHATPAAALGALADQAANDEWRGA